MKKVFILLACCVLVAAGAGLYIAQHMYHAPSPDKETFDEVWNLMRDLPESVPSSNGSWLDPDYSHFYQSCKTWARQRLPTVLSGHPPVDTPDFVARFNALTQRNKKKNGAKKKIPTFADITVAPSSKLIVFGSLHGALHSFKRDLIDLKKKKLLDDNFHLADGVYLFVLGDAINRSPYSIELLRVLLPLLERNDGRCFYVRGVEERNGHWEDFLSMNYLVNHLKVPFRDALNAYFDTLPDGMCVFVKGNDPHECFYLSATTEFTSTALQKAEIKVMIMGEQREAPVTWEHEGLDFWGFNSGVALWAAMSSQTLLYQTFMKFFYDSYSVIDVTLHCNESIITLWKHDVRKPEKEEYTSTAWFAAFGIPVRPSGIPKEIKVGSTMALLDEYNATAMAIKDGFEASLMRANEDNVIPGYFIRPIILDDMQSVRRARANVLKLKQKYGVDLIVLPQGTQTLDKILDLVNEKDIFVAFPRTGLAKFRDPNIKNILHFRPTYDREMEILINFMIDYYKVKKFAFVYQSGLLGDALLNASHKVLQSRGITTWLDVPFVRDPSSVDPQLLQRSMEKLILSDVEVIAVLISSNSYIEYFLAAVGISFFVGRYLIGPSFLEDATFRRFVTRQGIDFTLPSILPNVNDKENALSKKARKITKEYGVELDVNTMEGVTAGELIIQALKQIGQPFTAKRIFDFFESMHAYDFFGAKISFDPKTRSLTFPIFIRTASNVWREFRR